MLWKNGVFHYDISPSNLMCSKDKSNGVLYKFDLAMMDLDQTGNEHTGTIPFMVQALLTKGRLAGKIRHVYVDDAESFVWVLTWISLCYKAGVLRNRPSLDTWMQVDATQCSKERSYFLQHHHEDATLKLDAGSDHKWNWLIGKRGLAMLCQQVVTLDLFDMACDILVHGHQQTTTKTLDNSAHQAISTKAPDKTHMAFSELLQCLYDKKLEVRSFTGCEAEKGNETSSSACTG